MQLLKKIIRNIRYRKTYDPLIKMYISEVALRFNYEYFASIGKPLIPVLKANAYGHGLKEVASILDTYKPLFLAVDSLDEAIQLRRNNIHSPILILGYCSLDNMLHSQLPHVTYVISSISQLKEWSASVHAVHIHLEVNTGMNRHGIEIHEMQKAAEILKDTKLTVTGICSHFADADVQDSNITNWQVKEWSEVIETAKKLFPTVTSFHLANTEGSLLDLNTNATRVGGGLYGLDLTSSHAFSITKPVMSIETIVTSVRDILQGAGVGYNHSFIAPKHMRIASIPMGYNEGIDRRLSNKGMVYIQGKRCPIVGRVSMNITLIDVSSAPEVKTGDVVEVISSIRKKENSLDTLSMICNTISYDLAVHISPLLRRIIS